METFENREKKVLSFMEEVQDELLMKKQDDDFLNSIDYKLKKLDQCNKEGKELCLDTIIRKIYKDCTPLNDDYKVACNDELDDTFDLFMARKCPKGMEFYVREGLKKNSPFAKKVLEAVENLVNEQTNDMQATINAGMNNQKNMAITHTNIKSLTMSPKRHTERNNTQMYCIVIHNGLSVSFIVQKI